MKLDVLLGSLLTVPFFVFSFIIFEQNFYNLVARARKAWPFAVLFLSFLLFCYGVFKIQGAIA